MLGLKVCVTVSGVPTHTPFMFSCGEMLPFPSSSPGEIRDGVLPYVTSILTSGVSTSTFTSLTTGSVER